MAITIYLSTITLNEHRLNTLAKWYRVTEWIRKQNLYICCLQETSDQKKYTVWK